jgi:chemotaxis protein MotA
MTAPLSHHDDLEPRISGTPLGLLVTATGLIALVFGIALATGTARQYLDIPSVALVLGGTIGATLLQYSVADIHHCVRSLIASFQQPIPSPFERAQLIVELAHSVREHGLLTLEHAALRSEDHFLRSGLRIAADGDRMNDLRPLLENEMYRAEDRLEHAAGVLTAMGGYAPAMGLIGTLIGLIQMLSSLKDPSLVGPSMSLALVSTLYGALAANICFLPLAGKLRARNQQETLLRRVTIEGVCGLSSLESPILLTQRLRTYLVGTSIEG